MRRAVQSHRRRYPRSGIGDRASQLLWTAPERGARTPLVHDLRRWPIDRRLPGRVLDARDFGRVFEHVAAGGLEIGKRVVAGGVPARTPAQLHVLLQETPDAAHHLIETAHLECGVVEAGRTRDECEAVVNGVATQEAHEIPEPVAHPKPQKALVEGDRLADVRRVQNHMGQRRRNRLPAGELPLRPSRNAAGDLNRPAVQIEEPEAVSRTGPLEAVRPGDQPDSTLLQELSSSIDSRSVGNGERNDIEASVRGLAQSENVGVGTRGGREVSCLRGRVCGDFLQSPGAADKRALGRKVRHGKPHVTQADDSVVSHICISAPSVMTPPYRQTARLRNGRYRSLASATMIVPPSTPGQLEQADTPAAWTPW